MTCPKNKNELRDLISNLIQSNLKLRFFPSLIRNLVWNNLKCGHIAVNDVTLPSNFLNNILHRRKIKLLVDRVK